MTGFTGERRPAPTASAGDAGRIRPIVRGAGQTLATLGVVMLLFVVYEVWVSNFFAHRNQHHVHSQYQQALQKGQDPLHGVDRLGLPSGKQVTIAIGEGFANIYIPRFGKDYVQTIVEGTDPASLDRGPGHYRASALPGQIGNFAVAGHRVGKGEPFLNLDRLQPNDPIVVQTAKNWYVYRMLGDTPDEQGVVGREIVSGSTGGPVLDPVPNRPGVAPSRALLTLTTCHPKFSDHQRMVIHALLNRAVAVANNGLPAELGGRL